MVTYISEQILFLMALILVLWVPGRIWVLFLERKGKFLTDIERISLAISLSVVMVDFLMIILGRLGVPLTALTIGLGIIGVSGSLFGWTKWHSLSNNDSQRASQKKTSLMFLLVFSLAIAIKMFYFIPNIIPASTDLGHHVFWVQKIVLEKKLPIYEEQEITKNGEGDYIVGATHPISDFIIGEHLVLSAVAMLSGKDIVSGFSMMTLFVLHIATLLVLYSLGRRLFEKRPYAEQIGTWTLFFFGVLYALGQSQMRYVTGGAVGNVFGNLFIPMIFLVVLIALRYKRMDMAIVSMCMLFTLAYTHHLSTLLFMLVFLSVMTVLVLVRRDIFVESVLPIVWNRRFLVIVGGFILFFFFFYTPSYVSNMAVDQVVGAPKNEEHLGFSFLQLVHSVGESRMALGLAGITFLLFSLKTRRSEEMAILVGWTVIFCLLVLFPAVFRIDLPSARVANYIVFPLSILSGYAMVILIRSFRFSGFPIRMRTLSMFFLIVAFSYGGFKDNNAFLKSRAEQDVRSLSVFSVAEYSATHIADTDVVMHDHIHIPGDAWIKIFFNRDYNYPFYRALLFRYDRETDKQEKCTLQVLSQPNSKEAKKCESDLNVRAIIVDEKMDGQQFQHFQDYDKVYADKFHAVYARSVGND